MAHITVSRWARRALLAMTAGVCVVAMGWSVLASAATHRGYQQMAVQTGSMAPHINTGDLVISRRVDPAKIEVGDVITFREPFGSHLIFTHRVVQILHTPAGPSFATKGDRNADRDPWTIHYSSEGWKVAKVIPYAGQTFDWLHGATGHKVLWASVFLLVLLLIWPIIVADPEPEVAA